MEPLPKNGNLEVSLMKKTILVCNDSVGGTVSQMFKNKGESAGVKVIGGFDDFSHGPLSTSKKIADFWNARLEYWKSFDLEFAKLAFSFDLDAKFRDTIRSVCLSDEVEFWCAHTVKEQFFLTVVLHLLNLEGVDLGHCKLRQVTDVDAENGLGVLDVSRMAEINAAVPSSINVELYCRAWDAIADGTAGAINNFVRCTDADEPITMALEAYLLRFPEFNGGLGSIDRVLLSSGTAEMGSVDRIAMTVCSRCEPKLDNFGHLLLANRIVELSRVPTSPWFEIEGDLQRVSQCNVRLTENGLATREKFEVKIV